MPNRFSHTALFSAKKAMDGWFARATCLSEASQRHDDAFGEQWRLMLRSGSCEHFLMQNHGLVEGQHLERQGKEEGDTLPDIGEVCLTESNQCSETAVERSVKSLF
jgi:hypothetical protein